MTEAQSFDPNEEALFALPGSAEDKPFDIEAHREAVSRRANEIIAQANTDDEGSDDREDAWSDLGGRRNDNVRINETKPVKKTEKNIVERDGDSVSRAMVAEDAEKNPMSEADKEKARRGIGHATVLAFREELALKRIQRRAETDPLGAAAQLRTYSDRGKNNR